MTLTWGEGEDAQANEPAETSPRWLGVLVIGVFAIAAVIGYAWNLGFAALLALAGLLSLPVLRSARPNWPVLGALAALTVWSLISLGWTLAAIDVHALHKYKDIERLTPAKLVLQFGLYSTFVCAAAGVSRRWAERAGLVLGIGFLALAAMLFFEALRGAEIYLWLKEAIGQKTRPDLALRNVGRGGYTGALLMWVCCAFLFERGLKAAALALLALLVTAVAIFNTDAVLAAMAVGLLVFLSVKVTGRIGVWTLIGAAVVYWIGAPFVVRLLVTDGVFAWLHPHVAPSWDARLNIWGFTAAKILEQPLIGWGLDASRAFGAAIPLHTHDAALQIWLELGLVGAALMTAAWVFILLPVVRMAGEDRTLAAVCAATAASYLTIGALSFGVWQEWWLALGALAYAACAVLARSREGFVASETIFLDPL